MRLAGGHRLAKPASSTDAKGARSLTPTQQRALALWRRGLWVAEIARRERVSRKAIMERLARVFRKVRQPLDTTEGRGDADIERLAWAKGILQGTRDLKPLTAQILECMVKGRSWRETAVHCGISRDAVRKRVYRLRNRHPMRGDRPNSSDPMPLGTFARAYAPPPTRGHESVAMSDKEEVEDRETQAGGAE